MSLEYAKGVIAAEIRMLQAVHDRLDEHFVRALDLLTGCTGRIVCSGVGKAGLIARKVAASLASTGSPAFFLDPVDALHGDLGAVCAGDVSLLFSNSGETVEITKLLPCLRRQQARIVAVTGNDRSTLAAQADVTILLGHIEEACPHGLAPTATTTAMLAVGDAIALALMQRKGFGPDDYAQLHPAGTLGRKSLPVEDVMRVGEGVAAVNPELPVSAAVLAISRARSGAAVVVDEQRHVLGIFTDGDLRRLIEHGGDLSTTPVGEVMTRDCQSATAGTLAGEVLEIMRRRRIAEVPVADQARRLLGVVDLKGLTASL